MTKFVATKEEKNRIHRAFVNFASNKNADFFKAVSILILHGEESLNAGGSAQYFLDRFAELPEDDKAEIIKATPENWLIEKLEARAMTPEEIVEKEYAEKGENA